MDLHFFNLVIFNLFQRLENAQENINVGPFTCFRIRGQICDEIGGRGQYHWESILLTYDVIELKSKLKDRVTWDYCLQIVTIKHT